MTPPAIRSRSGCRVRLRGVPVCGAAARSAPAHGFTLVELLIVISIIAILASLSLAAVVTMRERTNAAAIKLEIDNLDSAIERYYSDEGQYPGAGEKLDEETNQFPFLINALIGERRPAGPGGRSAPYVELNEERIVVRDDDLPPDSPYRPAERSELRDPKVKKYYLDHFGQPYVYRCNRGHKYQDFMRKDKKFDLYSLGSNEKDETMLGEDAEDESDDIGNW